MKFNRLFLTFGFAYSLAASMFCLGAHAADKFYDVVGSNVDELIAELNTKGPNGGWAYTLINYKYSYDIANNVDSFSVANPKVLTTVIVTYPNWKNKSSAKKCLKDSWDKMMKSLKNHEAQHLLKAKGVDGNIKSAILATPPSPSVDELKLAANKSADSAIADNQKLQDQFDLDTDHGKDDPVDKVVLNECP